MKKVLITGGSGFIGRCTTQKLIEEGVSVRWASREKPAHVPAGVEHFQLDVTRPVFDPQVFEGCSHLIHLVAREDFNLLERGDDDGDLMYQINVLGTHRVLEAARKAGIEKAVVVSSANTCGWRKDGRPNDGIGPMNVSHFKSVYVYSRYQQEYVSLQHAAQGFPVVIAAPSIVVGAGDKKVAGPAVAAALKGLVPMVPPAGVNFIAVQDVAQGLINALKHGKSGAKYLFVGENMTWKDFFGLVAQERGKKAPLVMPKALARFSSRLVSWMGALRGCKPSFGIGPELLTENFYFSASKAVQEIQLPQTPISVEIKKMVQALQGNDRTQVAELANQA